MSYVALRWLLVVFVALVLGLPSLWLASRPSRPTSRLGMRGKKRQQGLLRSRSWATIEPFVRWTGVRANGVLPLATWTKVDTWLTHAGDFLGMTADEAFGATVASALVGGAVFGGAAGYRLGPAVVLYAVAFGLIFGAFVPYVIIEGARTERLRTINRSLPNAIDLLALTMSAGFDFPGALRQLVERARLPEALSEELEYMLQQLQLGHTRAAVLREFAARTPAETVAEFAQAVVQAEERGNPVAGVLEVQALSSRQRRTNLAESAAEDMKAKLTIPFFIMVGVTIALVATPGMMMMDRVSSKITGTKTPN